VSQLVGAEPDRSTNPAALFRETDIAQNILRLSTQHRSSGEWMDETPMKEKRIRFHEFQSSEVSKIQWQSIRFWQINLSILKYAPPSFSHIDHCFSYFETDIPRRPEQ
jgi:hypothetical protein